MEHGRFMTSSMEHYKLLKWVVCKLCEVPWSRDWSQSWTTKLVTAEKKEHFQLRLRIIHICMKCLSFSWHTFLLSSLNYMRDCFRSACLPVIEVQKKKKKNSNIPLPEGLSLTSKVLFICTKI